jgi:dihydroxyacid dehydratase/phosphogluconate dehydratase
MRTSGKLCQESERPFIDQNSIPGCDKNMPGVLIAAARHNRPFVMIYGGTIRKGYSKLMNKYVNISTVNIQISLPI